MTTDQDYFGIIPARGGSKGVERKNIKPLAGRPLIAHTIEAASNADELDRAIVTTDDPEIRQVAQKHGADAPFLRPQELATDEAPMAPVVEHAVSYLENEEDYTCSAAVLLQPTAPLRNANHIDRAIENHREPGITTVISTFEDHSYRWQSQEKEAKQLNYTSEVNRRQDKTPEYVENGAIYIVEVEQFLADRDLRSGSIELFEMPRRRSIDIDTEFDFWLAEQLVEKLEVED
jgi:N-acylneuraminate cytidylyltransferase/CMP-N,N'-diacetyllegionaminic acid synthase